MACAVLGWFVGKPDYPNEKRWGHLRSGSPKTGGPAARPLQEIGLSLPSARVERSKELKLKGNREEHHPKITKAVLL